MLRPTPGPESVWRLHRLGAAQSRDAVRRPWTIAAGGGRRARGLRGAWAAAALIVPIAQDATLVGSCGHGVIADRGRRRQCATQGRLDRWTTSRSCVCWPTSSPDSWSGGPTRRTCAAWRTAFLAFGPEVDANLSQVCRAAVEVTGADFALYNRRQGDSLATVAGWNMPDDLPRVTEASGPRLRRPAGTVRRPGAGDPGPARDGVRAHQP